MEEWEKRIVSGLIGAMAGLTIGAGIVGSLKPVEDDSVLRTFQTKETPKIQRLYQPLRRDSFFVEYPENSGEYILLNEYLEKIPNKKERAIKKSKIKELLSLYY